MNELSLVVPLSLLPADVEPSEVLATLQDSAELRAMMEQMKGTYNSLIVLFRSQAANLKLILDEVDDEFEKVKALRGLASKMRDAADALAELL